MANNNLGVPASAQHPFSSPLMNLADNGSTPAAIQRIGTNGIFGYPGSPQARRQQGESNMPAQRLEGTEAIQAHMDDGYVSRSNFGLQAE